MSDTTETISHQTVPEESEAVVDKVRERYAGIAETASSCCGGSCATTRRPTWAWAAGHPSTASSSSPAKRFSIWAPVPVSTPFWPPGEWDPRAGSSAST